MKDSVAITFLVVCLVSLSSGAVADGLGRVLRRYPEFSKFTDMLNDTGLIKKSHGLGALTALAVHNDQMGVLEGQAPDVIERVLSVHVVLDYLNVLKIKNMAKQSELFTNLFQHTGTTDGRQGYINVTKLGANKEIFFRSAVRDAPFSAKLVREVYTQPFNNCVLQVSNIIYTPGIEGSLKPAPVPLPAPVPEPPVTEEGPVDGPAEGPAEEEEVESPAEPPNSPGPAPADAPAADEEDTVDDVKNNEPPTSSSSAFIPSFFFAAAMTLAGTAF
ncbi:hypothetical protein NMG60_11001306 [Bertholletia excelsa]